MPQKKPKSISRRNHRNFSFFNLDPLFDQLAPVFEQIDDLPSRVSLGKYWDAEREDTNWREWNARVKPVRNKLEQDGVNWQQVLPIIAQWRSALDVATISQLAKACLDVRTQVLNQIKARNAIQHYISSITAPPIRGDLKQALQEDCDRALQSLEREHSAFQDALRILQKSGSSEVNLRNQKRKRDPATPRTVKALHALLSPHITSRRKRAQLIFELLKACNQEYAPTNPETIRSGYR